MNKINGYVRRVKITVALTATLLSLCAANNLYGQAVNGSLLGTVTDATGAVLPGATVVITEIGTNINRSAVANEDGNYVFTNVKPGIYRVEAESTGFKKTIRDQVEVTVNSTVRTDIDLQPGSVTEEVTVTQEDALLQTDRADVGRKIEGRQVVDLPLPFNRNFQGLLNLVPGTQRAFRPHSQFFNSQDSLSTRVNGQSRLANNVQVEGIDNNHRTGLLTVLIPPIEAIQTVDVTTSNYEAELGRAGGAVTNVALKSGTNEFRGSAFWFNRVSATAARNVFAATKAPTVYNLFGFTFGGPIIKNKTFFFGDYQGVRDHRGSVYRFQIPTQAFRNGDFRGAPTAIYDPATGNADGTGRQQIQCNGVLNVICPERISPIARRILSFIPAPTSSNPTGLNFERNTVLIKDTNSFDVKINHQFDDNDNASVRYSYQKPKVFDPGIYGIYGGPANGGFGGIGITTTQSAGINYTHVFNPLLVTEVRFGFSRYRNDATSEGNGLTTSTEIGIPGANVDDWSSGISSIEIDGYGNPVVGFSASLPWIRAETNFNLVNNWTRIFGNHTVKWGADVRRERDDLLQTQTFNPRGVFRFNQGQTSLRGGPAAGFSNSFASFLLDQPNQIGRDLPVIFPALRQTAIFGYLQDKWQVSQKLTLDLGLRVEHYNPLKPRLAGGLSNYDPATNSLVVAGVGDNPLDLGVEGRFINLGPRFGLAYRLNEKTVFRGGFGISTIPFPDNSYAYNYPVKQNNSFDAPNSFVAAGSMVAGFPGSQVALIPANGIIPATTSFLRNQVYDVVPR
nr:TonB-dependent receptor [Pyrinomonadaceae bacterium]